MRKNLYRCFFCYAWLYSRLRVEITRNLQVLLGENPSVVDQYDDYVQQKEDAEAQGKKFMWINSVGTYRAIQFYEDGTYQYVNPFGFSIEDGSNYYDFIHDGETMVIGEKEYDFELDGDTLYLGQNELIRTSDSLEDYVVE